DFARGLAVIGMVQAHAYGAWVRAPERTGLAFRITRFVATLPLPAFLLLAGVGLSMRVENAGRRGEHASKVRLELVRRGFWIVPAGYAVSLVGFLIDGGDFVPTVFRADVLHAIGLSLALYAAVTLRGGASDAPDRHALVVRAAVLGVLLATASV